MLDAVPVEHDRTRAGDVRRAEHRGRSPEHAPPRQQLIVAPQERTVYQVVRGGGRVTAGTDAPINPYGLSLLMELENYAAGGLRPVEVLRTANESLMRAFDQYQPLRLGFHP